MIWICIVLGVIGIIFLVLSDDLDGVFLPMGLSLFIPALLAGLVQLGEPRIALGVAFLLSGVVPFLLSPYMVFLHDSEEYYIRLTAEEAFKVLKEEFPTPFEGAHYIKKENFVLVLPGISTPNRSSVISWYSIRLKGKGIDLGLIDFYKFLFYYHSYVVSNLKKEINVIQTREKEKLLVRKEEGRKLLLGEDS